MKKRIVMISTFIGLFLFTATASADSPLTSTPFYTVYEQMDIVKEASEKGIVNSDIATYLADEKNPIDAKAAVINALSWDFDGKNNAETYSQLIYGLSIKDLDVEVLSGDQQFCIGYLMAMDDYFNTDQALEYLKMAEIKMEDSFTVSIIKALVESMDMEGNVWVDHIEPVLSDSSLNNDFDPDSLDIILEYMILYKNTPEDIPGTGVVQMELIFGIGAVLAAVGVKLGKRFEK